MNEPVDVVDSAIKFVRECKIQAVDVEASLCLANEVERLRVLPEKIWELTNRWKTRVAQLLRPFGSSEEVFGMNGDELLASAKSQTGDTL